MEKRFRLKNMLNYADMSTVLPMMSRIASMAENLRVTFLSSFHRFLQSFCRVEASRAFLPAYIASENTRNLFPRKLTDLLALIIFSSLS